MALLYFIWLLAFFSISDAYRNWFTMEGEAFVVKCPDMEDNERVTWHLPAMNTTISTDERMRIYSSGINLWFLPISVSDSGNYICVKHKSDSQMYESVSVSVHPYKNGICYYDEDLYSYTSGIPGSGKIYCPSIDKYKNASDVMWYKDCEYLHGSRYTIQNSILYISGANKNDNGNYTCQFTYSHGGRKFNVSATRTFEVVEDPSPIPIKVIYPQDNEVIKVEIGTPQNLSCKALLGLQKQHLALCHWDIVGDYDEYHDEYHDEYYDKYQKKYMVPNKGYFAECVLSIKEVREQDLNVNFTCVLSNDMEYKTVTVTLQCKEPSEGHKNTYLIVGFVTLLIVATLSMALLKFFLVDIVLLYRRLFNCTKSKDDGKIYDAYVIYPTIGSYENNFMGSFVHQILPEVLENQYGYTLCIYGRDVLPGEDTMSSMEKRIQMSRRLIILLTKCLATNDHFTYEHQIAFYSALIQNNNKVILLEMERIRDYGQLQESLQHLINQQGTIKWKEKYMCHPFSPDFAFWKHVRYQMPVRRNPSVTNPIEFVSL